MIPIVTNGVVREGMTSRSGITPRVYGTIAPAEAARPRV
jgi:hypothetical protein